MWWQSLLAAGVKDSVRRMTKVTDAETWAAMKYRDSSLAVPQVQIRELRGNSILQIQAALDDIDHGATFEEAVRRWSDAPAAKSNGGLSGYFPITDRPPIGEIAGALNVGQRYGPLRIGNAFIYFEVVGKKSGPLRQDSAFSARYARARAEVSVAKARRTLTLMLAQIGKQMGFDVFADRVRMIEVTPVSMMTFRVIGFGGKMPAVPFVDPQLDWLGVEPPEEIIP
jgi:parvulin-like peptidyl-prolyl isomerase